MARKRANGGGGWIRPELRLAIYLRDAFTCVYCLVNAIEAGIGLSLDHVHPAFGKRSSDPFGLVTCCLAHNSRRKATPYLSWTAIVAAERGESVGEVRRRVQLARRRRVVRLRRQAAELCRVPPPWLLQLRSASAGGDGDDGDMVQTRIIDVTDGIYLGLSGDDEDIPF